MKPESINLAWLELERLRYQNGDAKSANQRKALIDHVFAMDAYCQQLERGVKEVAGLLNVSNARIDTVRIHAPPSLQEQITELRDRLDNSIKYDKKLNRYILFWTKRQIAKARKDGKELAKRLKIVPELPDEDVSN